MKKVLFVITALLLSAYFVSCSNESDCWSGCGEIYAFDCDEYGYYFYVTDNQGNAHKTCVSKMDWYKWNIGDNVCFY